MGWLQTKFPERFGIIVDTSGANDGESKETA